jgi:hypothetical protein
MQAQIPSLPHPRHDRRGPSGRVPRRRRAGAGHAFAVLLACAGLARADVTGSWGGSLDVKKTGEQGVVTVGLIQIERGVSGTVQVSLADAAASGFFWVTGTANKKGTKVKLTGENQTRTKLKLMGKMRGGALAAKVKLKGPGGKYNGKATLALDGSGATPDVCANEFFAGQVMGRVLVPICSNCHVPGGAAAATSFRVVPTDALATQQSVAAHVNVGDPATSRIVQKPTARVSHGGGLQVSPGSPEESILMQWADLASTGEHCGGGGSTGDVVMIPIPRNQLLVRAAMDLRGVRPTLDELNRVESDPAAYGEIVDAYLQTEEFIDLVKDAYDDALLVRREDFSDESRDETAAIWGEALELIAHVVRNDRPFDELGTADYTVANELFQRDTQRMPFPMEPVTGPAWQPSHYLDGRPHAGLLSTSAFYRAWDTNNTNVNRRRANRWSIVFHCYNFLDTPVDVTRDVDNADDDAVLDAVTTRADCKACHDRLDPMASFLFAMDNAQFGIEEGDPEDFYNGDPERWRRVNRRPPAVYGRPGLDVRDMGRLMTEDPRFAECQTRRAFKMLFQRNPETNLELSEVARVSTEFRGGYDYRGMVKNLLLSDAYTQRPLVHDERWVRRASPERLERLFADLTRFVWTRDPDDDQDDADPESDPPRTEPVPLLTSEEDGYRIILGSINGVTVTGRSHSLNAPVVIVHRKLAALAADHVVATDLTTPVGQRTLLATVGGDEDPAVHEAALRAHLVRIARRLYGIRYGEQSPEIDNWFQLYANLHRDRTQASSAPGTPGERAWRGVLVAMLRSPRLLIY